MKYIIYPKYIPYLTLFQSLCHINLKLPQLKNDDIKEILNTHFKTFSSLMNKSIIINDTVKRFDKIKTKQNTIVELFDDNLKVIQTHLNWIGINIVL